MFVLYDAEADKGKLTTREIQIAALVVEGFDNREIAQRLCISENTVKDHLKELFDGLRIRRRTELVAWCLSNPEAFGREWASIARHARGCRCNSARCSILRATPIPPVPFQQAG
jgi:DNA-binding CsgD family transcriptional regulator